ncbi:uncharacterized protein LOC105165798 [Sesamum indicum]|uniref:Uncharacterized protein LOC105165798 n=1 Tax=Sesamum indicum TaxID=4182 RepID=A0A6I9TGV9_SESIN|nr:uncharacterized protein LOC105165798 [Sesamum indicum]XP_011083235.1 uncharacterized protein LOC105165798 [Sesamum indicum]XP_020550343.1 uncharacterized protein LOC105165798 [Sesamum indicum]
MSTMMGCSLQLRLPPSPPPTLCYSSYSFLLPTTAAKSPTSRCYGSSSTTSAAAAARKKGKQVKAVLQSGAAQKPEKEVEDEDDFQVLTAIKTAYNHIIILDTPKSRLLLLDSTHNVHSMLNKGTKWTGSYWDEFATLPPLLPQGPIAIFGLGGGTSAHLMLDLWPSLQLEGWEIDEILIDKSRDYLGLCDLEKHTADGGVLNIHIGDAFSPDAAISGGYAGIIVDLFAEGKALPQLEQAATWLELYDRLMPNGRFMVNCGAGEDRLTANNAVSQHDGSSIDGTWKLNATIRALCEAFPGQVNWKKMPQSACENYLALTGSLPDLCTWSDALPNELKSSVNQWRAC